MISITFADGTPCVKESTCIDGSLRFLRPWISEQYEKQCLTFKEELREYTLEQAMLSSELRHAPRPVLNRIDLLVADGLELERIRQTFTGIPIPVNGGQVMWRGEMAEFIALHLS